MSATFFIFISALAIHSVMGDAGSLKQMNADEFKALIQKSEKVAAFLYKKGSPGLSHATDWFGFACSDHEDIACLKSSDLSIINSPDDLAKFDRNPCLLTYKNGNRDPDKVIDITSEEDVHKALDKLGSKGGIFNFFHG